MITLLKRVFIAMIILLSHNIAYAQQVVINVDVAGTLSDKIAESEKYNITDLKLTGKLNGTDILYIREMAGTDSVGNQTDGQLINLDLSETQIVAGGLSYYKFYDAYYINADNTIGDYMFANTKLQTLVLPNSTTIIGNSAFYWCYYLKSITIPNSVIDIGEEVFFYCGNLTAINVEDGNNEYSSDNGVLYNFDKTTIISYPEGKTGLFTIPGSVTSIGNSAFYSCKNLNSIIIPNSVESIGYKAFYECKSLTNITIPNSVSVIGEYTFCNCESLSTITIPNSVVSVADYAFAYCSGLTNINISNSVVSIGVNSFAGCIKLLALNVEVENSNYSSIDGILYNKDQTQLLKFPESKAGEFTIPNSVATIGFMAFYGCCGLTSITIPNSVTSIGDNVLSNCSNLISINVESGNTNYSSADGVLYNKDKTQILTFPASKAGEFVIPNSVTKIGLYAFCRCLCLTSLTIPNSVTNIDFATFDNCNNLISFNVDEANVNYSSVEGVVYNKDKSLLLKFPLGKKGSFAIPNTVKSIEDEAFANSTNLTSLYIPNYVTNIGNLAFFNCSGLTSVTIPNSVTNVGTNAFFRCVGLKTIVIPKSLTSIGSYAFSSCTSLQTIYNHNQDPMEYYDFFDNTILQNATLYVPKGSYNCYKSATGWENFINIQEMDDTMSGVNNITDNNFGSSTYFTIDAKKTANPQRGLNIIKNSDGTVRKVLVK